MEFEVSQAELHTAKQCMLKILKKVHEVCEKHQIKYWLDYGTLLGAVRHNGFIPWDDDLDISMLREDYEKWCKIAPQELGEEFFWQTLDTEPCYHLFYGKVRLVGTYWGEEAHKKSLVKHKGIFVDVFPVDYMPSSKLKRKIISGIYRLAFGVLYMKHLKRIPLLRYINTNWCQKICEWLAGAMNKRNNKNVSMWYTCTEKYICPVTTFDDLILHKFEDGFFYIPSDYDAVLTRAYGNYMQLPPVEKRIGKHTVVNFDFGKYANN